MMVDVVPPPAAQGSLWIWLSSNGLMHAGRHLTAPIAFNLAAGHRRPELDQRHHVPSIARSTYSFRLAFFGFPTVC